MFLGNKSLGTRMAFLGTRMVCSGRVEGVFGVHIGALGAMGFAVGYHKRDPGAGWPKCNGTGGVFGNKDVFLEQGCLFWEQG